MSQSTARVGVIGDLMLEHFEGFLLVGDVGRRKVSFPVQHHRQLHPLDPSEVRQPRP